MQKEKALQFLTQELDYSLEKAENIWADLSSTAPEIQDAFESLVGRKDIGRVGAEGYTVARLMEEYQMTPAAALLTLNWLIEEPEIALQALAEGYDKVVIGDDSP